MAEDFAPYGVIDPRVVYDIRGAARAMGQSVRWLTDNLIDTDAIDYRKQGDYKGIPGWQLIAWVESDLRSKSKWKDESEPEMQTTRRKSASKPLS